MPVNCDGILNEKEQQYPESEGLTLIILSHVYQFITLPKNDHFKSSFCGIFPGNVFTANL